MVAKGFGLVENTGKCICEKMDMSNWRIVHKTTIKVGKQFGKPKAIVYCEKCRHQWETSAKYIEKLNK